MSTATEGAFDESELSVAGSIMQTVVVQASAVLGVAMVVGGLFLLFDSMSLIERAVNESAATWAMRLGGGALVLAGQSTFLGGVAGSLFGRGRWDALIVAIGGLIAVIVGAVAGGLALAAW